MAVIDKTKAASAIPTIVANNVIKKFMPLTSVARTISRDEDWANDIANMASFKKGDILNISILGSLVSYDKAAGSDRTRQAPSLTSVSVTLDTHKEVTVSIDDVTKAMASIDLQAKYGEQSAVPLARDVEDYFLSKHGEITNTITWDATSDDTIDAKMRLLRQRFTQAEVPVTEQKYIAAAPSLYADILGVDKYVRYDARGQNPAIAEGNVLRIYGFEIAENSVVNYTGSPGAYHSLAYTRDSMCLAVRPLGMPLGSGGITAIVNDPETRTSWRSRLYYDDDEGSQVVTTEILFGGAIVDNRKIIEIEST